MTEYNNIVVNVGSDEIMFFAKPGVYENCGLLSSGHMLLLVVMIACISVAVYNTKNKTNKEVKSIIKKVTILLWILEIIKILFNFAVGKIKSPNNYIPLYYCSLILYAGLFSSFGSGILKRTGDIFIATGAIIGGICFSLCPNTSLTIYPAFHYISIQSFIFHGSMIYLGILVNITNYVKVQKKDIIYYSIFIMIMGIIAYIFNLIFDSNLMFVSRNYPNTPVEIIYNMFGNAFPVAMIVGQAIVPFYVVYLSIKYMVKGKDVGVRLLQTSDDEVEETVKIKN